MFEYISPSMLNREELRAQAIVEARNLKAMLEKYEPEDPTKRRNKKSYLEIPDDTPDKIDLKWKTDTIFQIQNELMSNNAAGISDDGFGAPTKIQSEVTKEMIAEHRAKSQRPLELYGKAYAYHPSRLAVDLEEFEPVPIRFDLKDEPEVKKQQIKWSKMIERNSEEIRRLIEVEIPKTQEEYGIERGEFEASIKSKADIEEITRLRATYDDIDANVNSKPVAISRAKALGINVNPSSHTKTIKNKILKELDFVVSYHELYLFSNIENPYKNIQSIFDNVSGSNDFIERNKFEQLLINLGIIILKRILDVKSCKYASRCFKICITL